MKLRYLLHRLRFGLHNKWWLLKYRFRELLIKLQFYWLLYQGSKLLNVNQKSIIVFSPHQDDEALGCGGMIALKREQGIPIKVVFVTDGGDRISQVGNIPPLATIIREKSVLNSFGLSWLPE